MSAALRVAVLAHILFFLALFGWLRPLPMALAWGAGILPALRGVRRAGWKPAPLVVFAPFALLALDPPMAFDETLYHLPIIRALATSGALRFLPDVRFPVFPRLGELLCVPAFVFAGDTATHFVALAEIAIAAVLLFEWSGRRWLAPALFIGSPLIVHIGTITYVDAALALFITAGFYSLDRDELALAGFFLGTACGVKYLGGYFAVAALLIVLARKRNPTAFIACGLAAALPTTIWIFANTHNPVFPFFGASPWSMNLPTQPAAMWRMPWDITFARQSVGMEPPVSPLMTIAALALVAMRDRFALIIAGYVAILAFLPHDVRYLVPLFPLVAHAIAQRVNLERFAWIAATPAIAYCLYLLAIRGLPPLTHDARERFLAAHVLGYAALQRAGDATVFAYGAEQLKYYARGRFVGDVVGPDANADWRSAGAQYVLISKRIPQPRTDGLQLVYEDAGAALYKSR